MRLLLIQGNAVTVYEGRKRLAVFLGASEIDLRTAEQLRTASAKAIMDMPVEA